MSHHHTRRSWLLWHPHQGLWNAELVRAIRRVVPFRSIQNWPIAALIDLDSLVLVPRALARRVA
jgi:hypothetical protein